MRFNAPPSPLSRSAVCRRLLPLVLLVVLLPPAVTAALAVEPPPSPPIVLFGQASMDGVPLTAADTDKTITLEISGCDTALSCPLYSYTMGHDSGLGDLYKLTVPADAVGHGARIAINGLFASSMEIGQGGAQPAPAAQLLLSSPGLIELNFNVLTGTDQCPGDPAKTEPGQCGCGIAETDSDGDGTPDCNDICSGIPYLDVNADGRTGLPEALALLDFLGGGRPLCESAESCAAVIRCLEPGVSLGFTEVFTAMRIESGELTNCSVNDDCRIGYFCSRPLGTCGGQGYCLPRPTTCPLEYEPVCGCDGETYTNACNAAAAGVVPAASGSCSGP